MSVSPMRATSLATLLFAAFVVAMGFGIVLPVLPFVVERLAENPTAAIVSQHTGLLTGLFMFAIFLFAPLWGRASDKWGRRPIILAGLIGLAASLAAGSTADSLLWLYVGRFLDGVFASAVVPSSMALIADVAPSKEWRARRFAWIGMAITAGFFIAPVLSGAVARIGLREETPTPVPSVELPFLFTALIALAAAVLVGCFVGRTPPRPLAAPGTASTEASRAGMAMRMLVLAMLATATVGALEVALTLRAKLELGLDPFMAGVMFAECSFIMFVAQAVVFSPLVRPEATRWLIPVAVVLLSLGMAVLPLISGYFALMAIVGVIAAAAGVLAPTLAYWMSLMAGATQGRHLGRLSAVTSAGQGIGSAAAGLFLGSQFGAYAVFLALSAIMLAAALWSVRLPWQLVATTAQSAAGKLDEGRTASAGKSSRFEVGGAHGSP